mmetsp:Transcript_11448/g.23077  ORF Transcript_11448/g.23077 Transcript_11448/m.23077 type:complete len:245 (-) Transcript_11448:500-1234(-)
MVLCHGIPPCLPPAPHEASGGPHHHAFVSPPTHADVWLLRMRRLLLLLLAELGDLLVEALAVVVCASLLVVRDGHLDLHGRLPLNELIMELIEVVMLERVVRRDSLRRVKLEQLLEQVDCLLARTREAVVPLSRGCALGVLDVEVAEHVMRVEGTLFALFAIPIGRSYQVAHELQLLDGRRACKHRLAAQNLAEDTPGPPHVHRLAVVVGPQEDLRRSVPPRRNVIREAVRLIRIIHCLARLPH